MNCENKFSLPKDTNIVRDPKGNQIGISTSNPIVIKELEGLLEKPNLQPNAIGIYLNAE